MTLRSKFREAKNRWNRIKCVEWKPPRENLREFAGECFLDKLLLPIGAGCIHLSQASADIAEIVPTCEIVTISYTTRNNYLFIFD